MKLEIGRLSPAGRRLSARGRFRACDTPVTVACVGWTGQPRADLYSRKLLAPKRIYQAELPRDGRPTFADFLRVPLGHKPNIRVGWKAPSLPVITS